MVKKNILCFIGLFVYIYACYAANPRIEYTVNTDWAFFRGDIQDGEKMHCNDSVWTPITIPHIMQLEKKHCGGDMIYDGVGWYRRYFKLPQKFKNKRIALSFEGVMNRCDVFVNGKQVSTHNGGYVGFTIDISKYVRLNENNLLAVKVSAERDSLTPPGKPQDRLDFYYYSGIYRDVKMIITDKLHISDELEVNEIAGGGIFVTYPEVTKERATVNIKTHLKNLDMRGRKGKLLFRLKDSDGGVVASGEKQFAVNAESERYIEEALKVTNPHLWHPYTPSLYTLECQVIEHGKIIDSRTEKIGIRSIKYTKEKGFFINGEYLYLVGANRHQSFPNIGDAAREFYAGT